MPNPPVKQSLGAALSENYDALQDDLRQANELAAGLEAQLAGKSKEVMHLKFLFEQTKAHLGHLQDSIVAMRKERHKLANDSMRVTGFELMLARVTAERDRLKKELEGVLEGLAVENAQKGLRFDKRDHQIAELTFELMGLRQELSDLRRMHPRQAPVAPAPPPRSLPLKTSAEDFIRDDAALDGVEVIPTERVGGGRTRA
jgi:chromosome segregation ATPase